MLFYFNQFELVEHCFGFRVLLALSELIDESFPPVPGINLNQFIQNVIPHIKIAIEAMLERHLGMSIDVHVLLEMTLADEVGFEEPRAQAKSLFSILVEGDR